MNIDLDLHGFSLGIAPPRVGVRIGRGVTVRHIQEVVADFYGIPEPEMRSDRRSRAIAWPRQVAMFLARELTPKSLPSIGRFFGNRDHTTVMHAIKAVTVRAATDVEQSEDLAALRDRLAA